MTTADRVLAPASDVVVEVVEGECLASHPRDARVFHLNPGATLIWGLCDGNRSARDICRTIQAGYPDAPASLLDDVMTTLATLEECGLVVPA